MLRPERKHRYEEFVGRERRSAAILLAGLFAAGAALSLRQGALFIAAYILMWIASYLLLFAGTCRKCVYYGKRCPVPLEGECVHRVLGRSGKGFGWSALLAASVAYVLRVGLPAFIIIRDSLCYEGLVYSMLFVLFWYMHIYNTGCPNCINTACPLNPDFGGTE